MPPIQDITGVFGIWDSLADMARDLDLEYQTVAKWSQRGRIPPEAWDAVIAAAKRKRVSVSAAILNRLNKPRSTANQVRVVG
jgi:adenylosuccinate lyase